MIAFILLKLLLFSGILFVFGWQLTRLVLNEKRKDVLIPLAAVIGSSVYLFFLNLLSYLIDIKINFYLLLVVFMFLSYFLFLVNRKKGKTEWVINRKWRKILFATCFLIMVSVGMVTIRQVTIEEMGFGHLPFAATIAEGNFPVKAEFAPDYPSQWHYGFNLFSAAISKITDLPIWFSYDFLHSIFIGILFLLGFILIKNFCKDNFRAYFASLVMIFGGTLNFLYGIKGIYVLYQKYILNLPIEGAFQFLNDMIFGKEVLGRFVMAHSQINWITLGFILTITVVYLYFRAINAQKNWFGISLLASIIFSFLALSSEIFFGVLCIVFLIYPFIFTILKKDWQNGKLYLRTSFLVLFFGVVIASFQGGIVTQAVGQYLFDYSLPIVESFSITPEYLLKGLSFEGEDDFLPVFSSTFFLRWGWLFIFISPTAFYLLKKQFQSGLFLIILIFTPFLIPLVVDAGISQSDFARINFLTTIFWNLIFGLFLAELFLFFKNRWQKLLIAFLTLGIILQGLLYSILFPIFPDLEKNLPFREEPRANPAELEAFDWIRDNTTIKDYFFIFEEEPLLAGDNSKFIVYTGRFAPTFLYDLDIQLHKRYRSLEFFASEKALYQKILEGCDSGALRTLNYRYLYINEYWPDGLEEKCLANNVLELKFEAGGGNNFARIYLLK